jgi:hypothetical protein
VNLSITGPAGDTGTGAKVTGKSNRYFSGAVTGHQSIQVAGSHILTQYFDMHIILKDWLSREECCKPHFKTLIY